MNLRTRLAKWANGYPFRVRMLILFLVSLLTAALLTRFSWAPPPLATGEVAPRDLIAPMDFRYVNQAETDARRADAEALVPPVYDLDLTTATRVQKRISQAFDMARRRHNNALLEAGDGGVPADARSVIASDFVLSLDITLDAAVTAGIAARGFDREIEDLAVDLVGVALRYSVIEDRMVLPSPPRPIRVVARLGDQVEESTVESFDQIRSPDEVRQLLALHVVDRVSPTLPGRSEVVALAGALARAAIRPNFVSNTALTVERRLAARAAVQPVVVDVKRGTYLLRQGDPVGPEQSDKIDGLREVTGDRSGWGVFLSFFAFAVILIVVPWYFAQSTIRKFSPRPADDAALALLLVGVLATGRVLAETAGFVDIAHTTDLGALSLLVPVAGGAMLVRILINSETAFIFTVVSALLAGAMTDRSASLVAFYVITGCVGAAGVGPARERVLVLRAGLQAGLVGAGFILLVLVLRDEGRDIATAGLMGGAAVLSGLIGAVLALGVVPLFEWLGYITDYKLLEIANLNHPALKQLVVRAPGTYHHSAVVGSLSEAACEAVGANALLARVACWFHDIGKGLKPQYFVENQRDNGNRHDRLSPEQSAQVIINHVRDGHLLALQHNLPKPILDNIYMHHGTGIIQYFYNKAKEQAREAAANGGVYVAPDERLFRYPGPKPDSREAGIIMLADKVEAACRTIREPTEERIRAMIQQIINSVMTDGQFEDCPLTLRELYQIADSFTVTLGGIYHHRIEYPDTKAISQGKGRFVAVPKQGTITLEILNPLRPPQPGEREARTTGDYERVDDPSSRTEPIPGVDDS